MPYKPVGIDENSRFPKRVNDALKQMFVSKPDGIVDGQVPVWDANTQSWIAGDRIDDSEAPAIIDGGIYDPITNEWVKG